MENNGKGIFYGVIGVATLIVAIIGATFAYFTATAETQENIGGAAEKIGLTVNVEPVNITVDGRISNNLIPLQEENVDKALLGTSGKGVCVDNAGYTVCHIYKVTVTNTGEATTTVAGTAQLASTGENALADIIVKPATFVSEEYVSTGTLAALNNTATLVANDSATIAAQGTATFYFVVYLNNNGEQDAQQGGTYTGKVAFNSTSGAELQATFAA